MCENTSVAQVNAGKFYGSLTIKNSNKKDKIAPDLGKDCSIWKGLNLDGNA